VAKAGQENELLVVFKKSRLYIQGIQYDAEGGSEPTALTFEEALPRIACSEDQE
jgi:hypothetical protein